MPWRSFNSRSSRLSEVAAQAFIQYKNNPLDHLQNMLALAEVYPRETLVAPLPWSRAATAPVSSGAISLAPYRANIDTSGTFAIGTGRPTGRK